MPVKTSWGHFCSPSEARRRRNRQCLERKRDRLRNGEATGIPRRNDWDIPWEKGKFRNFRNFPGGGHVGPFYWCGKKTKKSAKILKLEVDRLLVLCGGFKDILFSPLSKGNDPIMTSAYFSDGLDQLNHQLVVLCGWEIYFEGSCKKSRSSRPGLGPGNYWSEVHRNSPYDFQ